GGQQRYSLDGIPGARTHEVPLICILCDQPQHVGILPPEYEVHLPVRLGKAVRVCTEVFPLELDLFALRQRSDYLESLFELLQSYFEIGKLHPVGLVLLLEPSRTDPEEEPSPRVRVKGTGHLREQGGIPEAYWGDHWAEGDRPGRRSHSPQRDPALR